jgi:hypothetical protein
VTQSQTKRSHDKLDMIQSQTNRNHGNRYVAQSQTKHDSSKQDVTQSQSVTVATGMWLKSLIHNGMM